MVSSFFVVFQCFLGLPLLFLVCPGFPMTFLSFSELLPIVVLCFFVVLLCVSICFLCFSNVSVGCSMFSRVSIVCPSCSWFSKVF